VFSTFLLNILGHDFSIEQPGDLSKLTMNFTLERASGFSDLASILRCFSVTNGEEVIRAYSREQMLRLTALKMRELVWSPNTRDEFLGLIKEFEKREYHESPIDEPMEGIRDLIENVNIPITRYETIDYENSVYFEGILIPAFGSTAIFKSKLGTESFVNFLVWLFERYDTKMNCQMKDRLIKEYDIEAIFNGGLAPVKSFEAKDKIYVFKERIYKYTSDISSRL
jgi:hypothetical protein